MYPRATFEAAEEIIGDKDEFTAQLRTKIDRRLLETLGKTDLQQLIPDTELISHAAKRARDRQQDHNKAREGGIRSVGTKLQAFTVAFSDFFEAYAGIVEIVKGVSSYGGVAYGTLCILLTVGRNKQGREDTITKALQDLSHWLIRLDRYSKSYSQHPAILKYIADVFLDVILFARQATLYYVKSPWARLGQAIAHAPKHEIDQTVENIKSAIMNVVEEAHSIKSESIEKLLRQVNAKDTQEQTARLTEFQLLLGAEEDAINTEQMITSCVQVCKDAFGLSPRRKASKKLQTLGITGREKQPPYLAWKTCNHSSLLLLSGENTDDYVAGQGLCWLSPAAFEVATALIGPESRLAFYSTCRSIGHRYRFIKESKEKLLAAVILQILHWDLDLFGTMYDDIKRTAQGLSSKEDPLEEQELLLIRILSQRTNPEPVYIILDRIDGFEDSPVFEVVEALLDVIQSAPIIVKILAVAHSAFWKQAETQCLNTDGRILSSRRGLKENQFLFKIGWRQEEIDSIG